jgi:flagellar biosynthesis/type III secretory pathway M-ring protein FliF/YscJ
MEVLRQLMEDAQNAWKGMSVTQRVSIMTLCGTVSIFLLWVAIWGATSGRRGELALPMNVSPKNSTELVGQLETAGHGPARYSLEDRRIFVPAENQKDAIIFLASEDLLDLEGGRGFEEWLTNMPFGTTQSRQDEMMRVGAQNEVARLIQRIDGIQEAKVIYTSRDEDSPFALPERQTASVVLTPRLGVTINQDIADTVINLVSFAWGSRLDPRDVMVSDDKGRKFRARDDDSLEGVALEKYKLERARSQEIRDRVEEVCRTAIPGCTAFAFVDTRLNMDKRETMTDTYETGAKTEEWKEAIEAQSTEGPPAPPGTTTNVVRATNMEAAQGTLRQSREEAKRSRTAYQPSRRLETVEKAPEVEQITISAVVHLPWEWEEVPPAPEAGEAAGEGEGEAAAAEAEPARQRVSAPPLAGEELNNLERLIRNASGMAAGQENMEVAIRQVPWSPPLEAPPEPDPMWVLLLRWVGENGFPLAMLVVLAILLFAIYAQASRAIPSEEFEIPEEEALGISMVPEITEVDQANATFEQMRDRVNEVVSEDPKKAAGLVRKWLKRETG